MSKAKNEHPEYIQGYDTHYEKRDACPITGEKISPTWYVSTSGPVELETVCTIEEIEERRQA